MKNQTIGIEIEMSNIRRQRAAEIIGEYFGTENTVHHDGGYYDVWSAKDNKGRTWKCMYDSSIRANSQSEKCEMVSPILKYDDDIEDLQEIVRKMRAEGAKSSVVYDCGIHVHIGVGDHTIKTLKNLVNYFSAYQDVIYKALEIDEREGWCKKLERSLIDRFNERGLDSMSKGESAWYGKGREAGKYEHYNSSRYHGLNLHAVFSKGTIEFRLFNGTLHAGKIRAYIVFCLAMSNFALNARSIRRSRKNQFNAHYTMYEMLCRIGIKGDEFKNVKDHLCKGVKDDGGLGHEARYLNAR